jgi:ABC-type antimicrobial peptide transport system permease subunit
MLSTHAQSSETRQRLLGVSAAGLLCLSVLGLLGHIESGVVTELLSAGVAILLTIAALEIESRGAARPQARMSTYVGRVVMLDVIVLTVVVVGYLIFLGVAMRDFTF